MARSLALNLCSGSSWFVMADPMQYLLNPFGLMRSLLSIAEMGEGSSQSRLSSMMAMLPRLHSRFV